MTDKDFPSEVDLIRAAAAGDHVAYKVIMERYAPLVNAQLYGSVVNGVYRCTSQTPFTL